MAEQQNNSVIKKVQSKRAAITCMMVPLIVTAGDLPTKIILALVLVAYIVCQTLDDHKQRSHDFVLDEPTENTRTIRPRSILPLTDQDYIPIPELKSPKSPTDAT